ncbi:SDR family NAD(P)-dependent oxidoreductase [Steroidobacter sp.]|uniref:SDR family NAD(P)-dependent oxidoreductase n=1 Tax=Steroidobacter sp. TaxID=1978227 RepID=UPI001A5D116E|nr:SDR family oxidoreductase [Steroidobacter sp.]MBL8267023.1 SDR family oxidoreductase [Steroidobacter sp.]
MRVIITGGARGIGLAVAKLLAVEPWNGRAQLLLAGRNVEALEAAAAELRGLGAEVVTETADLLDEEAPARVVRRAEAAFGGLDGLVSNAGMIKVGPLASLTVADYEQVFSVNTRATFLLAQAAYPLLRQSRGSIVATSSLASEMPTPPLGMYSASKAALVMMIQQMAVEWGADGIRCNCVSPGSTLTPMTEKVYANDVERAKRERAIALRRIAKPEETAQAIAFLLGPRASFISGVNLMVDGGASLMFMTLTGAGSAHDV